ncbi:spidroin-1 [Triplophysa rosa]|uniref:Spidroin-1-like n=1 Tax=Triplophysa rosa TaxID=992332 RepID=A0A9W8CAR0_TRIRA|nr:spidroin-1 [Triplophysa rosa]KAI7812609.1 putative spidroin-1-like [Triplophysa rosa]
MGDNDLQMEITGQTQESSSGDKIDLSLDDIIKLNKRKQNAIRASNRAKSKRAAVLNKFNQIPQQQRGRGRGAQQYQGPGRVRGFRRQRGSGRGMMSRGSSVSPMNRAAASTMTGGQFDQTTFTSRGTFRGRGRGRGGSLSRGALSARGQRTSQKGGRLFVLDRGFSATRRAEKLENYQKISRRTAPSDSTLTVSLPNAKSAPVALRRTNQNWRGGAALRGRSSGGASTTSPKGIHLHFNYKATTNQTGQSLNDRFTDLKVIGRGSGRGRGRGRGDIAGGGRGRGDIAQGGRGRGNILKGGRGRGNILQGGRGRGNISLGGRGRGNISLGGRGRGNILQGGRGRGNILQGGRGRGNILLGGRGRGNILQGGRGRGNGRGGFTRGNGRGGFTRGRGFTRQADRTVTLQ